MGLQLRGKEPGRNHPCPCGSGLKYKQCHGDELKLAICNQAANEKMVQLIFEEKLRKGLTCKHGVDIDKYCKKCRIGD